MKVSGFTFLRNGQKLGYPFVESIRSVLPIVDEFVIALGPCDDDTEKMIRAIGDPKIRIIPTQWNERIRKITASRGLFLASRKPSRCSIARATGLFISKPTKSCTKTICPKSARPWRSIWTTSGSRRWPLITCIFTATRTPWSGRRAGIAARSAIIRNTIPAWSSEALFFNVVDSHKKSRYPRAAHTGATIYHYGWVRSEAQMNLKSAAVHKYWDDQPAAKVDYSKIDPAALKLFTGTHPKIVQGWLPKADGLFQADPNHQPTSREKKHRSC